MQKNLIIILTLIFAFSYRLSGKSANDSLKKNSVFIEIGGRGFLYSVGYDRVFLPRVNGFFSLSVACAYTQAPSAKEGIMISPNINYHIGKGRNKFLVGLGLGNFIEFYPYPRNKEERKNALANKFQMDQYLSPYKPYFIPCIGYERYFKKGNNIAFFFSPLIYSAWVPDGYSWKKQTAFFPWGGISYNFKF